MISVSSIAVIANASFECIPLEYVATGLSINSPSSENSMISSIFSLIAFSEKPSSIPESMMFSLPESRLTNPIPSAIRDTVYPCRSISPTFGAKIPAMERSSVDFPLPFFPTIPSTSPLSTEKERSFTASCTRFRFFFPQKPPRTEALFSIL